MAVHIWQCRGNKVLEVGERKVIDFAIQLLTQRRRAESFTFLSEHLNIYLCFRPRNSIHSNKSNVIILFSFSCMQRRSVIAYASGMLTT